MQERFGPVLLALLVSLVANVALAVTEGPFPEESNVAEPWAGWWWPKYCTKASTGECTTCDIDGHLWSGPEYGNDGGPIYNLDTKYFWKPEPQRSLAQVWEYENDRSGPETGGSENDGHCNGLAAASILEPEPPNDCGHLTQGDLKGLLAELYYDCFERLPILTPQPAKPGDLWRACRECLSPQQPEDITPFMLDITREPWFVNWYVIYRYKVEYTLVGSLASGTLTLWREDRYDSPAGSGHVSDQMDYTFEGVKMKPDGPGRGSGWWTVQDKPDFAMVPQGRRDPPQHVNPHVVAFDDTIFRVINHKTIVLDDVHPYRVGPCPPPDGEWDEREGFSGGCWAAPGIEEHIPPPPLQYWMAWKPHLGATGWWRFYIYKTAPQGDVLNENTLVLLGNGDEVYVDQSAPPFDEWQHIADRPMEEGTYPNVPSVANFRATPIPCMVYEDAFRLEFVESAVVPPSRKLYSMPGSGGRTPMVIDPWNGNVHVTCSDGWLVWHAVSSDQGETWEPVEAVRVGSCPTIACDSVSRTWVAYQSNGGIAGSYRDTSGEWQERTAYEPIDGFVAGPPSLALYPGTTDSIGIANVTFAVYDTSGNSSAIMYAKLGRDSAVLDTVSAWTSGLGDSCPWVNVRGDSIYVTWQHGNSLASSLLEYDPNTWAAPNSWAPLDDVPGDGSQPMSALDGEHLHLVWRETNPTSNVEVIRTARRYVGSDTTEGQGWIAGPDASQADGCSKAYPVYAGDDVVVWQEKEGEPNPWCLRANVWGDTTTLVQTDSNCYQPHAVAEKSPVSPSVDQALVRLLWTQECIADGDTIGELHYKVDSICHPEE